VLTKDFVMYKPSQLNSEGYVD